MHSYLVRLDSKIRFCANQYFVNVKVVAKALVRLHRCPGLSEPGLLVDMVGTKANNMIPISGFSMIGEI